MAPPDAALECLAAPGRMTVLFHLARTGETINMLRFKGIMGVTSTMAQRSLAEMRAGGVIDVTIHERGAGAIYEIRISPTGIRVAHHLRRANDVLQRAR